MNQFDNISAEEPEYVIKHLPYHLAKGCRADKLYDILIDFEFLNFKVSTIEPQSIIEDFDLALQEKINLVEYKRTILKIINDAIKLSANTLVDDVEQFSAQLWGRLQEYDLRDIQGFLEEAKQSKQKPWLRPLRASLTKPGGNLVRTLTGHKDNVQRVKLTSDGKYIISYAADDCKVWDIESGIEIIDLKEKTEILTTHSPNLGDYLEDSVSRSVITKDYQSLIAGMENGDIQVWDLKSKNCRFIFPGHKIKKKDGEDYKPCVLSLAVSPDGGVLAAGYEDGTVKSWNLITNEIIHSFHHAYYVGGIAITPDGKTIVSACDDETLKVWDLSSKKEVFTLTGHTSLVRSVVITPDGKQAISASADDDLKVWDLVTGKEILTLSGHSGWVADVAITPDGKRVVSASWDDTVKIWDLSVAGGYHLDTPHGSSVHSLLASSDGQQIISASTEDGKIKVWNTMGSEILSFSAEKHFVSEIALFPDDQHLLTGSGTIMGPSGWKKSNNSLKIWDLATGTELLTLIGHSQEIRTIAISPDGKKILSGGRDNTVRLWDVATGKELFRLSNHTKMINSVIFTPNGQKAISASGDETIKVWNLESGKELFTLFDDDWENGWVDTVILIPNSHKIISSHNHNYEILKIWDFETGEKLLTLTGKNDSVSSLLVTQDGKRAISGSRDGRISIWDLSLGEKLNTLSGHNSQIYSLALFPDDQHLVSTAGDNTIKIWSLCEEKIIATFIAESAMICCLVILEEMLIITGDWTGNVHFLKLEGMDSISSKNP